jgi:hypothetical protein
MRCVTFPEITFQPALILFGWCHFINNHLNTLTPLQGALLQCISDVEQIEAKVNNKHRRLKVIEEEQDTPSLDSYIIY